MWVIKNHTRIKTGDVSTTAHACIARGRITRQTPRVLHLGASFILVGNDRQVSIKRLPSRRKVPVFVRRPLSIPPTCIHSLVSRPNPSNREEWLVTFERFLGCALSAKKLMSCNSHMHKCMTIGESTSIYSKTDCCCAPRRKSEMSGKHAKQKLLPPPIGRDRNTSWPDIKLSTASSWPGLGTKYRMAGNFWGIKLSRIREK